MDDLIRSTGTVRGMRNQQYILKSLTPLRELPPTSELDNSAQIDLFDDECEGMCGV